MLKKLYIEPSTRCNLNCKMCFRNTWFDESIGDMSMDNYRHILHTMPRTVESIFFGGQGEPLVHREIIEMVSLAAKQGVDVELLTNGTLLNERMISGLIDAGLSRLWISIDDLDTGETVGSGHSHSAAVLDNIRLFNRMRQAKMSVCTLGITFVATKSNVHQLKKLPFFTVQYLIDEVNISNISPTDEESQQEMLYTNLVSMYTGPAKGSVLPTVRMPYFDLNIPEAAEAVSGMMAKQNFELFFNDQSVMRRTAYCRFIREGMCFVRHDGEVCPCMALLHNGYTYMSNVRRRIYRHSFGSTLSQGLEEIWNSAEYKAFRRKFDDFDFSPCIYCGHCDMFSENKMDCTGNSRPTCGGCLWAEGVLSCP